MGTESFPGLKRPKRGTDHISIYHQCCIHMELHFYLTFFGAFMECYRLTFTLYLVNKVQGVYYYVLLSLEPKSNY